MRRGVVMAGQRLAAFRHAAGVTSLRVASRTYWEFSRLRLFAAPCASGIAVANVFVAMEMFMFAIQVGLALLFGAAGLMKLVSTDEQVARNPQFSKTQVRLLGLAEVLGAVGLVVPTATGIAPHLTRVAAVCLATLMGGAVATLALSRRSAVFPTVVALLLIGVATVP